MDSLTQIVLGAAVGELVLGRKIGNKAQLIGAIAGTIPDLDVIFTSMVDDDLRYLQIHRGYSHAFFTHVLIAFPLAGITWKLFKEAISYKEWYVLWFLGLVTHALLDCCTTFGTQFLLPFTNYLVGFNNISVIDPLYTIPFMILLIICLFLPRAGQKRRLFAKAAVAYSIIYMALTFVVKFSVHQTFSASLASNEIKCDNLYTTPTILNAVLWSAIAERTDSIFVGEYSILQSEKNIRWIGYPRNIQLLDVPAKKEVEVMKWFSQGKYFAQANGDTVEFFNIKWGRSDFRYTDPHKAFIFYFKLYPQDGTWRAQSVEPTFDGKMKEAFQLLWQRIFENNIPLKDQYNQ